LKLGVNFFRIRFGVYSDFNHVNLAKIVSELGFYAWTLSDDKSVIEKGYGDYLVRSKKLGVDEGGICTGFAFIDTYTTV
jgi:Eukaryotic glutathione synthase, ATP binding domain